MVPSDWPGSARNILNSQAAPAKAVLARCPEGIDELLETEVAEILRLHLYSGYFSTGNNILHGVRYVPGLPRPF